LSPPGGIAGGIASIRCWDNRLRYGWKCKAGEQQREEKETTPDRRAVVRCFYLRSCHIIYSNFC
jgi:hypothetical protein